MKTSKKFWNYLDMFIHSFVVLAIIVATYYVCEHLERYIYRYTVFPFVAFICVFTLGVILGNSLEKTSKAKPVGFFSKKMAKSRKKKKVYIFKDDEETYIPRKQIVEEIKSGNIVHVKKYKNSDLDESDFEDIYNIDISDILDSKMDEQNEEKE